jgi:hypothetical protein
MIKPNRQALACANVLSCAFDYTSQNLTIFTCTCYLVWWLRCVKKVWWPLDYAHLSTIQIQKRKVGTIGLQKLSNQRLTNQDAQPYVILH